MTRTHCVVLSLVFSQSLISLDLIEDFLELAGRAKEEGKPSPYKGKRTNESLHERFERVNISQMNRETAMRLLYLPAFFATKAWRSC